LDLNSIQFKVAFASQNDILNHLEVCDSNFSPALSSRVDLILFSNKIFKNGITFEAWIDNKLIGLIAAYFNFENMNSFITHISIDNKFMGFGISSKLMIECIKYSRDKSFIEIKLEVFKNNLTAISLYKKHDFKIINEFNETLTMNHLL